MSDYHDDDEKGEMRVTGGRDHFAGTVSGDEK